MNYVGGYGGLLTQSPSDASPAEMPKGDLETARAFGERVAQVARSRAEPSKKATRRPRRKPTMTDDTTPQTQLLRPHDKDLGGGFNVRRLLPAAQRRSVGPFVFFDHFGPATEQPGTEHDVRPHPHIGLATVTYLFKGAMMHRDSLGSVQEILPGAINWMTSGAASCTRSASPTA
jgi:hypothetical protein